MRSCIATWVLGVLATASPCGGQDPKYDPTASYKKEVIQGFTVLFSRGVLANKDEASEVRTELTKQLAEIVRVVPSKPLAVLRKVRVWVEWERKKDGGAEFHPSAKWLRDNGYNLDKEKGVEISNSRNFLAWSRAEQPCMVLHEFAHAYHFIVLGENHVGIAAAYKQAIDRKLYDEVEYAKGGKKEAYARKNEKEYFAELTEAYFGKNDYYPFRRTDVEKHDPVGYKLLQRVWGKPRAAPSLGG